MYPSPYEAFAYGCSNYTFFKMYKYIETITFYVDIIKDYQYTCGIIRISDIYDL